MLKLEVVFNSTNIVLFLQVSLAMLLGMVLGVERSIAGKTAGMRTYALVSMGACLFVVSSAMYTAPLIGFINFDPLRIASGIITGVGFLGAGIIIFRDTSLRGLTTAAGLWVAAGIGIAVGYELYALAVFTTTLTLFIFTALWFIEEFLENHFSFSKNKNKKDISTESDKK